MCEPSWMEVCNFDLTLRHPPHSSLTSYVLLAIVFLPLAFPINIKIPLYTNRIVAAIFGRTILFTFN